MDKWRCEIYNDYLNHEVYGRLEEKYIDMEDHARKKLVLRLYEEKIIEVEAPYIVDGLYDTLKIGDELAKKKGSTLTVVTRGQSKNRIECRKVELV
ncbi:MAG: hypothetical protein ABI663_24120 [Chryseolinea sp.]